MEDITFAVSSSGINLDPVVETPSVSPELMLDKPEAEGSPVASALEMFERRIEEDKDFSDGDIIYREDLKEAVREMMSGFLADIEFRLAQTKAVANRQGGIDVSAGDQLYVEDIVSGKHHITGYVLSNNSPAAGSIAWSSLHVVFMGVDYTIANGNTANKYAWFIKPASGTTATLQTGNTLPVLGPNDALIFVNNSGVGVSATETSLPAAVAPGSITTDMLAATVNTILSGLRTDVDNAQATADGAIFSYFQPDAPWANGTSRPASDTGDVWYDSDGGASYRWSGPNGTPVNTWVKTADIDTSGLTQLIGTKVATYVGTTAPTAPSGGFTTGDLWIDQSAGNVTKRWSGSAWVVLQLGDAAISGIAGSKVGSGISATNVTTGTLSGSLVGTGINATNVTTGTLAGSRVGTGINGANINTNTIGQAQIAPGAVQPQNINAAFHLLY